MSDSDPSAADSPPDAAAQVKRLVAAGVLTPGSRSLALLDYLADHWQRHGPDVPVKAYAIALDVLGRGKDFDPASDSIVRVEIGRLRKVLSFYAEGPGRYDPVLLSIPLGQNALQVQCRLPSQIQPPPLEVQPKTVPPPRMRFALWLGGLGGLLALGAAVLIALPHRGPVREPILLVEPIANEVLRPDLRYLAPGLEAQLVSELSHYRSLRVREAGAADAKTRKADYRVRTSVAELGDHAVFTASVSRAADDAVIWSGRSDLSADDPAFAEHFFAAVRGIVVQVAGRSGIIAAENQQRAREVAAQWPNARTSDFLCYLHWQSFDETKNSEDERLARACLARLTGEGSRNGTIWSAQAFMTFLDWSRAGLPPGDPMLDDALAAAARGIALDPTGSEGHETLASILLARRQFDEALLSLEKAVRYNPSNPELRAKAGWQHSLAGEWELGVAEIGTAMEEVASVPGWFRIPLALDAFRRGDFAGSLAQAQLVLATGDRRGKVLALAAALAGQDREADELYSNRMAAAGLTPEQALAEVRAIFDQPELIAQYAAVFAGAGR